MAFEKNNHKISNMLRDTDQSNEKIITDYERTKQYQFTLQPSVRKKIDQLAKENGYRSASSFINSYFKEM